ncbi:glycosyltransferase family 4 protein [soil metagenome]
MNIAVLHPDPVPYVHGGAERAAAGRAWALSTYSPHQAEVLAVAVREDSLAGLVAGYRTFAELDLGHFDMVVSAKYPTWIAPHPRHVLHMAHPLRGVYDTYHLFRLPYDGRVDPALERLDRLVRSPTTDRSALAELFGRFDEAVATIGPDHADLALPGPLARRIVHFLDRLALTPPAISRHLTVSRTVASRPGYFPPGVIPRPVHHPTDLQGLREGGADHLFTASRLDPPKRIDLLIDAMAHVPGDFPLLIAGSGPAREELERRAAGDRRIRFLGFVPDEDLAGYYADALAVPFLPLYEDMGLITLEAMNCATPVVTCRDSGGVTEFCVDGITGLVADPTPESLGAALTRLVTEPDLAHRLGQAGKRRAANVTWRRVARALLAETRLDETAPEASGSDRAGRRRSRSPAPRRGRPKLVVTSTFRLVPARGGGQLRCLHLYGALARHVDVEVVCLVHASPEASRKEVAPGLIETAVPASAAHEARGAELTEEAGVAVTDVVAGTHVMESPAYLSALQSALHDASGVLLAHPFLLPAFEVLGNRLPRFYDAHNLEVALKAGVLPANEVGRRLLAENDAVERRALATSEAITVCSATEEAAFVETFGVDPTRLTVIPNGTDTSRTPPSFEQRRGRSRRWRERFAAARPGSPVPQHLAVFFASWHPPNIDAGQHLLHIAPELPDTVFLLGGSHGEALRYQRLPPNVVVTGVIDERAKLALLGCADVALNPMRLGSGTNLKIIEYLAAGIPVVSTPFGARGLDVVHGEHLMLAGPDATVASLRQVFADPASAHRRSEAGRTLVEVDFSWQTLGDRLAEVICPRLAVTPPNGGLTQHSHQLTGRKTSA